MPTTVKFRAQNYPGQLRPGEVKLGSLLDFKSEPDWIPVAFISLIGLLVAVLLTLLLPLPEGLAASFAQLS